MISSASSNFNLPIFTSSPLLLLLLLLLLCFDLIYQPLVSISSVTYSVATAILPLGCVPFFSFIFWPSSPSRPYNFTRLPPFRPSFLASLAFLYRLILPFFAAGSVPDSSSVVPFSNSSCCFTLLGPAPYYSPNSSRLVRVSLILLVNPEFGRGIIIHAFSTSHSK